VALRRYKALEEIRDGHGRQVGKLAGIEVRTMTGTALLKPDVRLLGVNQSNHLTGAARTSIALDLVLLFARLYVADIERGRRFLVAKLAEFTGIKP
jgi:hypothetical protein